MFKASGTSGRDLGTTVSADERWDGTGAPGPIDAARRGRSDEGLERGTAEEALSRRAMIAVEDGLMAALGFRR